MNYLRYGEETRWQLQLHLCIDPQLCSVAVFQVSLIAPPVDGTVSVWCPASARCAHILSCMHSHAPGIKNAVHLARDVITLNLPKSGPKKLMGSINLHVSKT